MPAPLFVLAIEDSIELAAGENLLAAIQSHYDDVDAWMAPPAELMTDFIIQAAEIPRDLADELSASLEGLESEERTLAFEDWLRSGIRLDWSVVDASNDENGTRLFRQRTE